MEFDFDTMSELYKKDPTEFEKQRKIMLNEEIAKAPVEIQDKLKDTIRIADLVNVPGNPEASMRNAFELMGSKLNELQSQFTNLTQLLK